MTVVLDTNVLVAALVANGLCHEVLERTIRLRILATSVPLLKELDGTLRKKFTLTPAVESFLSAYRETVRLVEPAPLPRPVCRDPDDDVVLGTAIAAGATVLVTGDEDLLVLKAHAGVRIITPRRLLEYLDRSRST